MNTRWSLNVPGELNPRLIELILFINSRLLYIVVQRI